MKRSRRTFCKDTLKAAAGAGLISMVPAGITSCQTNKDRIVVGLVGCNGMGFSNLRQFIQHPDVEVAALCDVDQNVLDRRTQETEDLLQKKVDAGVKVSITKPKKFNDYRKLLEEKDIDAVIIGTPDHWHTLIAIHAMEAGKDIYLEKPMANTIGECLLIEKAAKKYKRVVQIGQWQRSEPHMLDAINYVHSGKLGKVRLVKTWAYLTFFSVSPWKVVPVPEGFDYDFWLGPAPAHEFNTNRYHFNWRWFWDYAGGLMTDWGVHLLDFALFGMQPGAPKSAMGSGSIFAHPDNCMETPDTQQTIYEFDGFNLIWEHAIGIAQGPYNRGHGIAFIGDKGTLVVDRGGWEVMTEIDNKTKKGIIEEVPRIGSQGLGHNHHVRNFIDCAKVRNVETNCTATVGREVGVLAHMGNVALRTGEKITWNNELQQFDNEAANAMILPEYRAPWTLPKVRSGLFS